MKKGKLQKWVAACVCGAFLLTGVTGCGIGPQQKNNYITVDEGTVQKEQIEQLADFSYTLLRNTAQYQKQDVLLSPLSAWLALSMTGQGAKGETAAAFVRFFDGMAEDDQKLLAAWLLQDLEGHLEGTTDISLANSIWCDDEITVNTDFLQSIQAYYRALVMKQDLQEKDAIKRVNGWIAKVTDNRIPEMLDQIDQDAVMLLINALTLEAKWQTPFDSGNTYKDTFYRADKSEITLEFMHQQYQKADYLQWEQGEGIVLPYDDGRLAMVALLPVADSDYEALLEQLSASWMQEQLKRRQERVVQLALPKFEINSRLNLNDICTAMGLEIAFDAKRADFTGLGTSPKGDIYISSVLQNCQLKVDEAGTEAAAATVVEMVAEGAAREPDDLILLNLNRPFVYLILDQETQVPLFAGIYQGE